jgi:preprotein translocase subunit SecF
MILSVTRTARVWFGLSGALLLISIIAITGWGLHPGIDFVGGSVLELHGTTVTVPAMRDALQTRGEASAVVQTTGGDSVLVRTRLLDTEEHERLLSDLRKTFQGLEERQFNTVGPTISRELLRKSLLAIVLATVGILLYLAFVFQKTTAVISSWAFGIIAVLVLLHDVLIATGFFALYARFWSASADSLFVTALLTTLGFSVHDTIVIFNRIKTNLQTLRLPFADLVDVSVVETLTRSLNTSMTTLLVLLALLLFGGVTIRPFLLTLSAGIIVGAYSSIFVAAPLVVVWQSWRSRRR